MTHPAGRFLSLLSVAFIAFAQFYTSPAGVRPAIRHAGPSILPGGRIIAPYGEEYPTGIGAFGLIVDVLGRTVVTSNGGLEWNSLTVVERDPRGKWQARQFETRPPGDPQGADDGEWRSVFMGLAFSGEKSVWASEGNSGRVTQFDWESGRRRAITLNDKEYSGSFTGDMALDPVGSMLYVLDQANFRVVAIDTKSRQVVTSTRVGRLPFALAFSPERKKLYVANLGMFQYRTVPGADPKQARETGLPFPAFGFPSPEAAAGAERMTARGPVQVPGLGDPNAQESNSICVVDVATPAAPKVETFIRTGQPFGEKSHGGSSPSGVALSADHVFVSNAGNDSISMIDGKTNRVEAEIPIRIPGLEDLRGVLPVGLAFHARSGWLLVAEAGINAIGVIDTRERRVIGHIPAGWFPTRVAIHHDSVFVTNARGHGRGPTAGPFALPKEMQRQGTLSIFKLPSREELASLTALVMEANGLRPRPGEARPLPAGVKHVVLIVKENRTYDEVFGDLQRASNGPAMGAPRLARFGSDGYADGQGIRLSIKNTNTAPNHRAIARRWAFSDNFYADGHHWLAGSYPNAWTESSQLAASGKRSRSSVRPEDQSEGGTIWHHFARHGISFFNFGGGLESTHFLTNVPMPEPLFRNTSREYPGYNMNIPDQYRASQFIKEIEAKYVKPGVELPRFLLIHLPNDHMAKARPEDGYPYEESFVADNDYALGRILEYLSGTKWWKEMAVLITEDDAQGGVDHIYANRTVMMVAGPWAKRNYVSHVNASFPALLKTVFRLLGVPALNLFDATAADLSDCFSMEADLTGYKAVQVDARVFDPGTVSPKMDAPR